LSVTKRTSSEAKSKLVAHEAKATQPGFQPKDLVRCTKEMAAFTIMTGHDFMLIATAFGKGKMNEDTLSHTAYTYAMSWRQIVTPATE
jgi:hypothetical protein